MKRGVTDVLRRGFDNTIANWPLAVVRFFESMLFTVLTVAAIIASIVPILLAVGVRLADLNSPDAWLSAATSLLNRWTLLGWILAAIFGLSIVFLVIHAFVEAGIARVLVDGERIAGPEIAAPRQRYRVFSMARWMAGGREGWWQVFWIYNATWGVGGLLISIPLLVVSLIMLALHKSPGAAVAVGCSGLVMAILFAIPVVVITGMWTNRALVERTIRRASVGNALSSAWQAMKSDFGRHLLIALAMIVIGMAASTFFASFSMFANFGRALDEKALFTFVTMPMRLIGSMLSWAFGALIANWYLASYSALALESRP